jgi:nucleoid DNA-binding protein
MSNTKKTKNYSDGLIISDIADDLKCSQAEVKRVIQSLKKVCIANVPAFDKFSIDGLFIAKIIVRPARIGRNQQTIETIAIPEKRKVSFKAGKALADAIA